MAGGSLAERHDAHQHSAARARHPDAVALDRAVQVATTTVLQVEGVDGREERHPRRTATLTYVPQTRCSMTAGSPTFRTLARTVSPPTDVVGKLTTSHWPVSSVNRSPARRCIENIDRAGGGAPGFFFDLGIRVRRPTYNHGGASAEVMLTRALLHRDRNNAHGRRGDEEASKSALARVDAGTARGSLAHAAADRTCQGVFPLSAREGAEARTTR
jgi:hypothetical protein